MNKKPTLNKLNQKELNNSDSTSNSLKILSDITRKDIENSYKIEDLNGTEAHYSDRYGWTLRRVLSK